jgi:metal-sulfur cluster biosynthetic enzyme
MNDRERAVNPHTGRPIDEEELATSATPTPGAGAAFEADRPGAKTPAPPDVAPAASAESGAPSQQELAIRSALETVMDPEINLSVIDLGLIREIRIEPGKTLVRMMLTTPFCPYAPQLMADVKQATQSVVDQECEVEIMPDPWSPEMMPDPGLLGFSY